MSRIDRLLQVHDLTLAAPLQLGPGVVPPFPWVRVAGSRVLISGHGPTNADATLAQPPGKAGAEATPEQAYAAARLRGLAILGSFARALGGLDRIAAWVCVFGLTDSAPGFDRQPAVINRLSDLSIEVFGTGKRAHARSAVGMAGLPFDIAVEIAGEVAIG